MSIDNNSIHVFMPEDELAVRHGKSVKTLRNQRVAGTGVPFVKLGRAVRYRLSDVLAYEQGALCTSTSQFPCEGSK